MKWRSDRHIMGHMPESLIFVKLVSFNADDCRFTQPRSSLTDICESDTVEPRDTFLLKTTGISGF